MVSLSNGDIHFISNYPGADTSDVPDPEHPSDPGVIQHRSKEQLIPHSLLSARGQLKDPNSTSKPTLQNLLKPLFLSRRTIPQLHLYQNLNIPSQSSIRHRNKFINLLRTHLDVVCTRIKRPRLTKFY
jgi:hypothetical protein